MSLKLNIDVVVVFYFASLSAITAQYSVSVERPCPMETVTFTCTAAGDSLRWIPSDTSAPITVRNTIDLNVSLMQSGYTVKLTASNDTTLTSTLSRTAENGITVMCVEFVPVSNIKSSTINLVDTPGPPSIIRHSTLSNSANKVNVTIGWDLPAETGGRDDLTYSVTISPPAQLSATVLTSTSVTVTAQYNVNYTVSVVTTNCAGNSTIAGYNFRIVSCVLPAPPLNGILLNTNSHLTEGSIITFQCDPGFSLVGAATTTCNNSGLWNPDLALLECSYPETGNVAAVAGGVVGSIVIVALIILVVIVLLVVLREKREESVRLKSNDSMEMDDKFDATVEPVIYAALSSSQPHKKGNTTATVDHHQVTYATVDVAATCRKQAAKAATLPTSPTTSASADVDKLLDIDQALVQIRSMKHKWRELAEAVRLPETLIEQIEDSCCNDNAGCLTEVINQWSCSGQPTWRELTNHLSKIGEEQLAKELMTIYDISCLPVELSSCLAAPKTLHKYDKTSPLPQSPTVTDDSPGLINTLPPSRPPKPTGEMVPARPPKPAPNIEPPAPPRPFKH